MSAIIPFIVKGRPYQLTREEARELLRQLERGLRTTEPKDDGSLASLWTDTEHAWSKGRGR